MRILSEVLIKQIAFTVSPIKFKMNFREMKMKYISEFRDGKIATHIALNIKKAVMPDRKYRIMEFCGGHTHAIHRYGLPTLLTKNIEMVHGPGCPVCVLPIKRINYAINLAKAANVIFCSYGDMLRVPGTNQNSLLKAKAAGADVRMVYSIDDALNIARNNPKKEIIFFAIGFETTTPPTAVALISAKKEGLENFSIFCNHVLTPSAMATLLQDEKENKSTQLDGFIGPAHVSILIGSQAYQEVAVNYQKPIVISGFEPLDILYSILMLIQMINQNKTGIKNQYTRAVIAEGNLKSQKIVSETLELREAFEWRGLGWIKNSALKIKKDYSMFDAELRFPIHISDTNAKEHKTCECSSILRGIKKPTDCKLFAKVCTPNNPLGACMVSSEGACAAYYTYGRI